MNKVGLLLTFGIALGALGIGGCGGALSEPGSHTGGFRLALGGGVSGLRLAQAEVALEQIDIRFDGETEYVNVWDGTKTVDLSGPGPGIVECQVDLGDHGAKTVDSVRLKVGRVVLTDENGEVIDRRTDIELTIPARLRIEPKRVIQVNLVLLQSRILVEDGEVSIDLVGFLEDNGIDDDGDCIGGAYGDLYFLDLSHMDSEFVLPDGTEVTGVWFNGDFFGFYVENEERTGGRLVLGTGHTEGTFTYESPARDQGEWQMTMPSIYWTGWEMVGTFRTFQSAIRRVPPGWMGVLLSFWGTPADFALIRFDAQGRCTAVGLGSIKIEDWDEIPNTARFGFRPLQDLLAGEDEPKYRGEITSLREEEGEFRLFVGDPGPYPSSGTWRWLWLYLLE